LIKLGKANIEIVTKIKYQLEFEEYAKILENRSLVLQYNLHRY
ncbi:40782_t:CDS:1, partial [Gigaspora margarita]